LQDQGSGLLAMGRGYGSGRTVVEAEPGRQRRLSPVACSLSPIPRATGFRLLARCERLRVPPEVLYAYVRATIDIGRQLTIRWDDRVIGQHRCLLR
jgi:hypothetical protein